MLHQISWQTYMVSIIFLLTGYYIYVLFTWYRKEIRFTIYRLSGRTPDVKDSPFNMPASPSLMGPARPDNIQLVEQEELSFAPGMLDTMDQSIALQPDTEPDPVKNQLAHDFTEMNSEVKTLVRVVNESGETKENFQLLFGLISQKYPELAGTIYQAKINAYLAEESGDQLPFTLSVTELENYWTINH